MNRLSIILTSLAVVFVSLLAPRAFAQQTDWERPPELPDPGADPSELTLRFGVGFTAGPEGIGVMADAQVISWPHYDGAPGFGFGGRVYGSSYFTLFHSDGVDAGAQVDVAYRTGGDDAWAYVYVGAGVGGFDEQGDDCGLQLFGERTDCNEWHRSGVGVNASAGAVLMLQLGSFNLSLGVGADAVLPEHVRGNVTLGFGGTFDLG